MDCSRWLPRVTVCLLVLLISTTTTDAQPPAGLRLLPPTIPSADAGVSVEQFPVPAERLTVSADPLPPPVESEIVIEDAIGPWYLPTIWRPSETWEGSIELGMNGSSGNAESFALQAGGDVKYSGEHNDFSVDVVYAKTKTYSEDTQHNLLLNTQYDWLFGESPWSMYCKTNVEYDEFKAFDVRVASNAGLGYAMIKHEVVNLTGLFGAGWSREFGGPEDEYMPEAAFGMNYEHRLTNRQKITAEVQYLPEWGGFSSYRFWTDLAWEVVLDKATNLNLKLSVNDRYDSTPNGAKHNDLLYSLLLLWKL